MTAPSLPQRCRAFVVREVDGTRSAGFEDLQPSALPEGELTVAVR
jgi:acrylyl-CoA reductase (NADPH)